MLSAVVLIIFSCFYLDFHITERESASWLSFQEVNFQKPGGENE
jgi:hypothetical protein